MLYRTSHYFKHPLALWKELVWHPMKYFIYRLCHGFDIRDTWSLDYALAKWILPRLKKFKEVNNGYPSIPNDPFGDTPEHWDNTLNKMIFSFQSIVNANDDYLKWHKQFETNGVTNYAKLSEHYEARKFGLELFGKYLQALWW